MSLASALKLSQARALQLAAQGLLQPMRRKPRRADLVAVVERMRMLQIDTIHVVARSPYLVLHSRLGDYPAAWLDEALAQGRLAECWAHEASFVGASDVALHRHAGARRMHHWAHRSAARVHREQRAEMEALLAGIADSGPVRVADFVRQADAVGKSGWWEWKPEKRWLEAWFALGALMVARRENFQRVYDLSGNVLARLDPPFDEFVAELSIPALRRRLILDSVRALGVTQAGWIADYYRLKPAVSVTELQPLLVSGELLQLAVQGWASPAYVHRDHAGLLAKAAAGRLRATHTTLLSPFDPLVWDRQRALAMFDFDYSLECYTPAAKRRYGYFVLPILHRGQLIGRLDAKAHRADGVFEIKALYLEPGTQPESRLVEELAAAIAATACWHGTPQINLRRTQPPSLARLLRAQWLAPQG